ncbi:MAG: tRNA (guanosine(37)-N1)-methyltransferase TrmD [Puniceicoccales bacterium]|jgi:tRNA (guanine37-N1)-methyltransferase|nr:tRNA (guanosine(37)-N1)-methyltransferase TrmD [Puniceicoccales bacterium]
MKMIIDLISLFPEMLDGFLNASIIARAQKKQLLQYRSHNLRQWSSSKHFKVDDRPFGGGAGMVLQPEPIARAINELGGEGTYTVFLCPDGIPLKTNVAKALAQKPHIIFLSGHYEGIDQRIRDRYINLELSIGDYVLTNGTLAAAVAIDVICRHIPGVLGNETSLGQDSFADGLLTFPQYTQPRIFENMAVPEVLLSGDHRAIEGWRQRQRFERTQKLRPDLLNE